MCNLRAQGLAHLKTQLNSDNDKGKNRKKFSMSAKEDENERNQTVFDDAAEDCCELIRLVPAWDDEDWPRAEEAVEEDPVRAATDEAEDENEKEKRPWSWWPIEKKDEKEIEQQLQEKHERCSMRCRCRGRGRMKRESGSCERGQWKACSRPAFSIRFHVIEHIHIIIHKRRRESSQLRQ